MNQNNRGKTFPIEILTDTEVQNLIRACSNLAPTGIRNRALIVLLYRGGLRIGEAVALEPKDVESASGAIRVLQGKGRKTRTIGIDTGAMSVIDQWQKLDETLAFDQAHFCALSRADLCLRHTCENSCLV